jgi:hypothetical protein
LKQLTGGTWEGNPVNAIGRIDPKRFSEALVASLNEQDADTLILVDEIALFVSNLLSVNQQTARDFLYHLRKLCLNFPRVRWLLTGSIGLDVVAQRVGLQGALVDLEVFQLKPFDSTAALAYLRRLCVQKQVPQPFSLDDVAFAHLARELGWLSPYYLRLVAERIRPAGDPISGFPLAKPSDIDAAFNELLEPEYRKSFSVWPEHIRKNFSHEEFELLRAILNKLCIKAEGETFETLEASLATTRAGLRRRELIDLITALVAAGFIHNEGGRWRFRSGLLRRYWLTYIYE